MNLTVYVTADLHRRMKRAEPRINMSDLVTKAIEAELTRRQDEADRQLRWAEEIYGDKIRPFPWLPRWRYGA
jgi:post-segregation antitoxin (ccd killing protein)